MDCETCLFYEIDDFEGPVCTVDMDEDDYARMMQNEHRQCPFYRNGDEYQVVKHQM